MHCFSLYLSHCVRAKSTTKASNLTRTCWPFYLLKFENDGQATNWLDVWPIGINTCTFKSVEKFSKHLMWYKVGCYQNTLLQSYYSFLGTNDLILIKKVIIICWYFKIYKYLIFHFNFQGLWKDNPFSWNLDPCSKQMCWNVSWHCVPHCHQTSFDK